MRLALSQNNYATMDMMIWSYSVTMMANTISTIIIRIIGI